MKKYLILISILIILPVLVLAQEVAAPSIIVNKIDLVWSADTYTPFDYQGRNLPVQGSKVTVSAIVSASGGNAKDLKYSWFLEDIFQRTKSGYGKDSFYFYINQAPGIYPTIKLQIFNDDRTVFEEKSIQIPTTEPEVVIYPSNGNSHFSNQTSAISTVLAGEKFSFIAKPYFFSINKLTDLVFEWNLAGKEPIISSDYNASVLDLTISGKQGNGSAESEIRVNVKNSSDDSQKADQSIKINIY